MPIRRLAPLLIALALVPAACKREAAPGAVAGGEILPGTASDAMLPQDRLTSQPPLDPRAERGAGGKQAAGTATEAAGGDGAVAAPAAEGTAGAD
ncbi:hypothetical protein ACFOD9_01695 [Novosphingobium bradum]|uniref:Uncharacterized protein n=1 Tax=Novosphingobium bradum TaxID=1737444 RepID=A0ABV7ILU2_9SPHN